MRDSKERKRSIYMGREGEEAQKGCIFVKGTRAEFGTQEKKVREKKLGQVVKAREE